jgi:hypothetical protein
VSLSSGDEVPHIFTRNSRLRFGEFLITNAKRLFQQHRPNSEVECASQQVGRTLFLRWARSNPGLPQPSGKTVQWRVYEFAS